MGWVIIVALALAVGIAIWRFAKFDRAALQLLAAALLLALAGYSWQGRPGLEGRPKPPPARERLPDSEFAATRENMLGRFDRAASWLTIAESYHRSGQTRNAVGIIRAGLRQEPEDADLWVGLGNALVIHVDGLMTPAAELAFRKASQLAPDHPGPRFFYALALAQGGQFDEAERLWRVLLESAPAGAEWRVMVEERLQALQQARAMGQGAAPP